MNPHSMSRHQWLHMLHGAALMILVAATAANAQQPRFAIGERVSLDLGAPQRGTVMRIGTEKPWVGCYFIHLDYQKSDPSAGDWHCASARLVPLDGGRAGVRAPVERPRAQSRNTTADAAAASARADAERYEKEAERLLATGKAPARAPIPGASRGASAPPVRTPGAEHHDAATAPELGNYECYAFSGGRMQTRMGLNFSITGVSSYKGVDGKAGTFAVDGRTGAMAFRGGALDGQHAKYEGRTAKHLASVNFVNSRGEMGAECDRAD